MYIQFTYLSAHNLSFSLLKKAAYSILCPCMYCHFLPMSWKKERMPIIPCGSWIGTIEKI